MNSDLSTPTSLSLFKGEFSKEVVVSNYAWLPKSGVDIQALKNKLLVKRIVPDFVPGKQDELPELIPLWKEHENDKYIGVPRSYFSNKLNRSGDWIPKNNLCEGFVTDYKCIATPKRDQEDALNVLMNSIENPRFYGGIIQAPTGYGKTVTLLMFLAKIQRTALIMVHRDFLIKQWKDAIEKFLPGCRVGVVRGNRCEFRDKDIVIAMVESLVSKTTFPMFSTTSLPLNV